MTYDSLPSESHPMERGSPLSVAAWIVPVATWAPFANAVRLVPLYTKARCTHLFWSVGIVPLTTLPFPMPRAVNCV